MTEAAKILWNIVLLIAGGYSAVVLLPKITEQFRIDVASLPRPLAVQAIATGFEGVGFLIAIWIALISISTWSWSTVSGKSRAAFMTLVGALLIGSVVVVLVHQWAQNALWNEYYPAAWERQHIEFGIAMAVVAFPIIVLRTGYIGFAARCVRRWTKRGACEE